MISLEKSYILTPLQKFLKIVTDLGKLSVAKSWQKSDKTPDLVTLHSVLLHW